MGSGVSSNKNKQAAQNTATTGAAAAAPSPERADAKAESSSGGLLNAFTRSSPSPQQGTNNRLSPQQPKTNSERLSNSISSVNSILHGSSQHSSPESRRGLGALEMESELSRDTPRSESEMANAQMFAATAMSLGLENDDLLFNLLYFGDGNGETNINQMFNSAMEETVALYSENNTPYKLRPASQDALGNLPCRILTSHEGMNEIECTVCKDDMEIGCEVTLLPACQHSFHKDCVIRWLKLQGWCPVCRAPITIDGNASSTVKATPALMAINETDVERDIMEEDYHQRFDVYKDYENSTMEDDEDEEYNMYHGRRQHNDDANSPGSVNSENYSPRESRPGPGVKYENDENEYIASKFGQMILPNSAEMKDYESSPTFDRHNYGDKVHSDDKQSSHANMDTKQELEQEVIIDEKSRRFNGAEGKLDDDVMLSPRSFAKEAVAKRTVLSVVGAATHSVIDRRLGLDLASVNNVEY